MDCILVFDIGTTAVKTCLFSKELKLLGYSNEEYQLLTPGNGRVELESDTYWQAVKRGIARVCRDTGVDPKNIRALTATTQGETLIPVDRSGRALYNAIVWLDGRASKQAAWISERFPPKEFYQRTGVSECNGYCPVAKLLWIKENEPEIYDRTYKFLLLEDYILMKFTGQFVTEKALLCTTGYFDIITDTWWDGMLEYAGIDPDKLPTMLECGAVLPSPVLPDLCSEFGFSAGTAVISSAMDQMTAAVGAGNLKSGVITETTGTGMCVAAACDHPDFSNPARVTIYRHIYPKNYLIIPVSMTAGLVLKWFKDEFCAELTAEAKSQNRSVYACIDDLVAQASPLSNGLILVPYLTGVLQPDNNSAARGVFFGIGLNTGKPEFLRAIFEGIAFMLKENVELIEQVQGCRITEIRSLGGGAKSRIWRKIKADINGVAIAGMRENECTALGAAILAAQALGFYPDAAAAVAASNAVVERIEPDTALIDQYEAAYKKYRALYDNVKALF
jgi:xylulokinase